MIFILLTGLFAGTTIACVIGWRIEYLKSQSLVAVQDTLLDRIQAPSLNEFRAHNPVEAPPEPIPMRHYSDPSGLVRFSEPR